MDFLRNIPGSLLCSELYEDWAEVVEEEEEEEKEEEEQVKAIQSLIGRLPAANAVLLRYVAALLHGIQGNADHNQMTSFNLSVCIAPSMLWAPGPSSPEQEGRGAKTVCDLVRFMIDHCKQIMESDPSSVFGGPPQRRDEETPSEESWSCHMTDSSYDSLENELDDDDDGASSGGSPALSRHRHRPVHRRHHRPPRGSLDSVLTLSDLDPGARTPALSVGDDDAAAALDAWSPGHGRRRQSEPAVAYAAKLTVCAAREEEEEEEEEEEPLSVGGLLPHPRSPGGGQDRRGSAPERAPPSPPPRTPPRSPPPLETLRDRPARLACRGLHPNSWLKEARRLSLTQQDHPETPEGDEEERRRPGPRGLQHGPEKDGPGKWAAAKPPAPAHHRSTGSLHFPRTAPGAGGDVAVSSPPQHLVHQPGATLSLFRHRRSSHAVVKVTEPPPTEGKPRGRDRRRRRRRGPAAGTSGCVQGGAPHAGPQGVQGGLRGRGPDASENCEPQSGQQGAPAPGRGRGQWRRRRHSSVMAEHDFNQLRFSEESYV
ncbi:unnamed protein product [Arctogadus glacialis]